MEESVNQEQAILREEVSEALRGEPITSPPKHLMEGRRSYRCVTASPAGLVRLLAENYIPSGYSFYVSGVIPESKDPRRTDDRLVAKYELAISSSVRCRRRQAGEGAIQYLRLGHSFVLLATEDACRFFRPAGEGGESVRDRETGAELAICDFRKRGLAVGDYLVRERQGHPLVSIAPSEYSKLKDVFLRRALREPAPRIADRIRSLPLEPYAPVREQLLLILAAVNRARKTAGLPLVPRSAVRTKRRRVTAYETN